jgi:shikimate kinase
MNDQRIIIIGFMGCGKTTVAGELARQLECSWADLDDAISKREGRTPGEIIEQNGEPAFRAIETDTLREFLDSKSERIIAAGGGAWIMEGNRRLISQYRAVTVWLDVPFTICWDRIKAAGSPRPLAASREAAKELYDARRPVYQTADVRVVVDESSTAESIAEEIIAAVLRQEPHGYRR